MSFFNEVKDRLGRNIHLEEGPHRATLPARDGVEEEFTVWCGAGGVSDLVYAWTQSGKRVIVDGSCVSVFENDGDIRRYGIGEDTSAFPINRVLISSDGDESELPITDDLIRNDVVAIQSALACLAELPERAGDAEVDEPYDMV